MTEYQVVIVGGGATGVGILRDLSMRGISALLLKQGNYMELRKLGGVIIVEGGLWHVRKIYINVRSGDHELPGDFV